MKRLVPLCTIPLVIAVLAFGVFNNPDNEPNHGFDLGLDLAGGVQLTYQADISELETTEVNGAISALQTVLEKRLNSLGSSDIRVPTETASVFSANNDDFYRVNVEIPGVFDVQEAKNLIGKIPTLEFRIGPSRNDPAGFGFVPSYETTEPTGISGKHVVTATISQSQHSANPSVDLSFDSEGGDLFFELTRDNTFHFLAIFLDGVPISAPVIQAAIPGGVTTISGNDFTYESAGELASNLKFGALPVPIELISTQSVSPSLGADIIEKGIWAGIVGFIVVALFIVLLYRLAGVVAVVALSFYALLLLTYFKFTGTDMTAAGIAGFIITIGMAVDANILIFERIREELADASQSVDTAIRNGFNRAWLSIRDGNISSIIVAVVLYYLTTSFVKGFALVFGVGVLVSMFTAIVVTRSLLLALAHESQTFRKILLGQTDQS